MKRRFFSVLLMLVFCASSAFAYYTYQDLQRAHMIRDRGDYYGARNIYDQISMDRTADREVRREAAYFIGFCDIRTNNPWRAIESYRNFLSRFDNESLLFVPDALFVLGRTYEDVRDINSARFYYNECIRRFRGTEYSRKSFERLRVIGGGNNNNNPYPPNHPPHNNPYPPSYPPHNNPPVPPSHPNYPPTYPNYPPNYPPNQPNYPGYPPSHNVPGHHSHHFSLQTMENTAVVTSSNPFDGFELSQDRISKVNNLVDAVKKLEGVDAAVSELSSDDLELEIVQEALKTFKDKEKFESLHEVK
ncbi:MAG: hypothetical protein HQM10_08655 [Candidatus Riflebacteria bacterium]|nr:hypothetical protein [Candidatus Riflebacteria bacterium]